jgi:hypothetical protein
MGQQHHITAELLWKLDLVWIESRQGPHETNNQRISLIIGRQGQEEPTEYQAIETLDSQCGWKM